MTDAADTAENAEQVPHQAPQQILVPRQRSFWKAVVVALAIGAALVAFGVFDSRQWMTNLAPDFTLTGYDGNTYRLSDLRGKVIVINFWASSCVPCRTESPRLEAVWSLFKSSPVVFLGVDAKDTPEAAQAFLRDTGVVYPTGPDNGIVSAYGIQGLPTTIVVDRNGNVANRTLASIEVDTLQALVQSLLSSPVSIQGSTQDQSG